MKRIYKDIEKEKMPDMKERKYRCYFKLKYCILFIAFAMFVLSDFFIPIAYYLGKGELEMDSFSFEDDEEEDNVILDFVYIIPIYIIINAYTVVTIFSVTRSTYISGDLLSGKNINDNISLMKTIKLFCEDAFVVIYCNLYYFNVVF